LQELFGLAAVGDFSKKVDPEIFDEEESRELATGIQIMQDVILSMMDELLQRNNANMELAEQRYRALIESSIDSVVISNDKGEIIDVNTATCNIFGYERSELIGQRLHVLMPEQYQAAHTAGFERHRRTGTSRLMLELIELEGRHSSGKIFPIELTLSNWKGRESQFYGAVIRDISTRKELIQNLEEEKHSLKLAVLELEHFAFAASHDLKEPIRGIRSFAQLLQQRHSAMLDASGKEYLDFIPTESGKLYEVTNGLLQIAGIRKDIYQPERNNIIAFLGNTFHTLQEKEQLALMLPEHDSTISFDKSLVKELFKNIVSNTVRFNPDRSDLKMTVAMESSASGTVLHFADNGKGVKDEYLKYIFLPFKRLQNKEQYTGAGLGLSIVKKIAELHGGNASAHSGEEGGLTISVSFPH
jgi:PAS domain S-box-containing protein